MDRFLKQWFLRYPFFQKRFYAYFLVVFFLSLGAHALELDWSGQFWAEYHFINNYTMDSSGQGSSLDVTRNSAGGYYVRPGGSKDAHFQSLFLRLKPKIIVNDTISIKSEWWVGDPVYGMFGNSLPYSTDQRQFYSNQSRGSSISAQRFWGEFITDFGTLQIGRVPLDWGLGLVWNGGDHLWDRYMSTGDAVRWVAKFGAFSLIPSVIMTSTGNTIGGSYTGGQPFAETGSGGVTDYSLIFQYENTDEDLEMGVNFLKRLGGSSQDPKAGLITSESVSATSIAGALSYMTYDLFVRKKFNRLVLAAEVPIATGTLAGSSYQAFALAGEANYQMTDMTELSLKMGHAPGQKSSQTQQLGAFKTFYFNPNYHIAMIMFNYQLANFSGPQTQNNQDTASSDLLSPYNNPIVNASYLSLSSTLRLSDKWSLRPNFAYAVAPQTAANGQYFYNYWSKTVQQNQSGKNQSSRLGWELDLGLSFEWDEFFHFHFDTGFYVPGQFYAFSNTAKDNKTTPVFATSFRIGVNF